jgi:hypothetical protein
MNKQMHTLLTFYYTVPYFSPIHVSTPTLHAQGALTRCLLIYINVFMHSGWDFFTFIFRIIKTVLAIMNYIDVTILGFFFSGGRIYNLCADVVMTARYTELLRQ